MSRLSEEEEEEEDYRCRSVERVYDGELKGNLNLSDDEAEEMPTYMLPPQMQIGGGQAGFRIAKPMIP